MYSANRIKYYMAWLLQNYKKESNKKTINCCQKNKISSQTNILKQKLKPDRSKYPWFNYCLMIFINFIMFPYILLNSVYLFRIYFYFFIQYHIRQTVLLRKITTATMNFVYLIKRDKS